MVGINFFVNRRIQLDFTLGLLYNAGNILSGGSLHV